MIGGLKIDEPAADLAVAVALASSYLDRPVPADLAIVGEIGLSGELRAVSQLSMRLNEAAKLGFKRILVPRTRRIGSLAAGSIGFYDGLIGPGTGSFLILILVAVLGFAFLNASAMAKVINLCTNLGAILVFGLDGSILWKVGLVLAVANVAGGLIGATLAIRGGSTFVRKIFLFITTALIFKVGLDTITMW